MSHHLIHLLLCNTLITTRSIFVAFLVAHSLRVPVHGGEDVAAGAQNALLASVIGRQSKGCCWSAHFLLFSLSSGPQLMECHLQLG